MAATLKCDTIQNASSATANITLDTAGNAAVGNTLAMGSSFLRNRIINGDMRIDQRNAGAAVTTSNAFPVDRFRVPMSAASKITAQQSTTSPTGFVNSVVLTSSSAYTVSSTDYFLFGQPVEGLNVSDLGWGSANAKTVTLSFWVRSSLTGTFGGSINNSAYDRAYPYSYTISAANTWEYKTATIAGDTSGTWLTTNGVGLYLWFGLGVGSTKSTTANAWAAGEYYAPTGATSVVGTNGATFYITGVQLEVGSVATPFERRQYGQELLLAQRYYYRYKADATNRAFGVGNCYSSTGATCTLFYPVTMRTNPTAVEQTGTATDYAVDAGGTDRTCSAVPSISTYTSAASATVVSTVASGQTSGWAATMIARNSNAYLGFSAEL